MLAVPRAWLRMACCREFGMAFTNVENALALVGILFNNANFGVTFIVLYRDVFLDCEALSTFWVPIKCSWLTIYIMMQILLTPTQHYSGEPGNLGLFAHPKTCFFMTLYL